MFLRHELGSFALNQDDDKTYFTGRTYQRLCPTLEQENVAETQRAMVSCRSFRPGLAEGIRSAEMGNLV